MPHKANLSKRCLALIALPCLSLTVQAQLTNNGAQIVVANNTQMRIDNNMHNSAGATLLDNGILQVNGNLVNAGTIKGNGSIHYTGSLQHTGTIAPGNNNIGELTLTGNYNNGSGILDLEIGSAIPTTGFDKLSVTGPVTASGTLQVAFINGYNPPLNQTFNLITGTTVNGTFSTTVLPAGWAVIYLSDKVQLVPATVLPIVLEYFKGNQQGNSNQIIWKVSTDGAERTPMTLERSDDSKTFYSIYSTETDAEESTTPFSYTDAKTTKPVHYYRLKIATPHSGLVYSNIIALQSSSSATEMALNIAPNPVERNGNTWLNFTAVQADNICIQITDINGRMMTNQQASVAQGANRIALTLPSQLHPGIYQVRIQAQNGQARSIKFVRK